MKIAIETQVMENYGDAENPYWKAKGGNDYVIENVENTDRKTLRQVIDAAKSQIECDSEYYREWVISWGVVDDEYLTPFEQSQLEYEGVINFPAQKISI